MKKIYNLALMPQKKSNEMVTLAQKFFNVSDKYMLGSRSLPHVTLYHFEAEENEIDNMWKRVSEEWKEKPINLQFNQFSCVTFDKETYWVALLPDKSDILHRMHGVIASIVRLPIKTTFTPHMTLINSKNKDSEGEVSKISSSYSPVIDMFILSLGKSDDIGQLTEVVYSYSGNKS